MNVELYESSDIAHNSIHILALFLKKPNLTSVQNYYSFI